MDLPEKKSRKEKSLRGALQSYAKPELIPLESKLWENRNLIETMENISDDAEGRGLTPEILAKLLEDE
jgi:hypothetical protein